MDMRTGPQSFDPISRLPAQWRLEGGEREVKPPAALCRGRHLEGQKYGILTFYTPKLAYCSQSNAIVVTIRITIGDLIAGMGQQQRRLPRAATTLAQPLIQLHAPCSLRLVYDDDDYD